MSAAKRIAPMVAFVAALGAAGTTGAAAPFGAVAFFDGLVGTCPTGWSPLDEAAGFALVGTNDPGVVGVEVGEPLGDREVPTHDHGYQARLNLPPKVIAAAGGRHGTDLAKAKTYETSGTVAEGASDLPFMQMQVCVQDDSGAVDSLPVTSVAFFSGLVSSCPSSWEPFELGAGRLVVPLVDDGNVRGTVGPPLESGEDRQHMHQLSTTVDIKRVHVIAAHSCCNDNPARKRDQTLQGATMGASTGVPYVQYLACFKTAATTAAPLASGLVNFFAGRDTCPVGWSANDDMRGRILIGLPEQAAEQATFGGPPLENEEFRDHGHSFAGTVRTSKTEVVASRGTTAGHHDWAKHKTYDFSGDTDSETNGVPPYVQLLACIKD